MWKQALCPVAVTTAIVCMNWHGGTLKGVCKPPRTRTSAGRTPTQVPDPTESAAHLQAFESHFTGLFDGPLQRLPEEGTVVQHLNLQERQQPKQILRTTSMRLTSDNLGHHWQWSHEQVLVLGA